MITLPNGMIVRDVAVGWLPDHQGRLRPIMLIDDRKPINRLKPSETFLRDLGERRFGRKASEVAAERALLRVAGKFAVRAIPIIGEALLLWDIYQWTKPGEELPRDPGVASDVELMWPSGWTQTDATGWQASYETNIGHAPLLSGIPEFYLGASEGYLERQWIPEQLGDPLTTEQLVNPDFPQKTLTEWLPMPAEQGWHGPAIGTIVVHTRPDLTVPEPSYANPPRTAPGEVVSIPVPRVAEAPQPFIRTNEDTHPNTERGPRPEPSPAPDILPIPPTVIITIPDADIVPGSDPLPSTQPLPSVEPVVVTQPNPDPETREPPGRGEVERKVRINRGGIAGLFTAVGVVTEALDILNAAWDALPKHCKPGYYELHYRDRTTGEVKTYWKRRWRASPMQRLKAVQDCAGEMDIAAFLKNLAKQDLSDRMWAKLGQISGQAGAAAGNNRGFQFGPWDTAASDNIAAANQAEQLRADNERRAREELENWYRRSARETRRQRREMHAEAMAERRRARRTRVITRRRVTRVGRSKLILVGN